MIGWLAAVFGASLLGSLHCAGMCGGFVACLAGDGCGDKGRLHGAYHLGRAVGYVTLGAVAGLLGAGIEQSALFTGRGGVAPLLFGSLIVLFAVIAGARALGIRVPVPVPRGPARGIAKVLARLRSHGPSVRGGALGLLTAFLPCGWLYAFVATAAGTGSLLGGVATMAVFWLGTVPMLLGLGLGTGKLLRPIRARLPLAGATLLLLLGLGTLFGRGLPVPFAAVPVAASARTFDETGVHSRSLPPVPTSAPCCEEE